MSDLFHNPTYKTWLDNFWAKVDWARSEWGVLSHSLLSSHLSYNFCSTLTLNASISLDLEDNIRCLVNMGTALSFYDYFFETAALADINDSGTYEDYLVAEREHNKERFTDYTWLPDTARAESSPLCPLIIPNEPTRLALANQFMSFAILFTVLHEEAHYLGGHLYLLTKLGCCSELTECPEESSPPISSTDLMLIRKHLELEADTIALYIILKGSESDHTLKTTALGNRMTQHVWCNLAMLVISSICCLFELAGKRAGVKENISTHPSAGCRWLNLLDTYRSYLRDKTGNELSPFDFEAIIGNIGIAAKRLDASPIDIEDIFACLFQGVSSRSGGPTEEYLALRQASTIDRGECEQILMEVSKKTGIDMTGGERKSDGPQKPYDLALRMPLSAYDNLRRSK